VSGAPGGLTTWRGTVAIGMERCVGNQIKKQPIKAWAKAFQVPRCSRTEGVSVNCFGVGDIDRTAVVQVAPERQPPKIGKAETSAGASRRR